MSILPDTITTADGLVFERMGDSASWRCASGPLTFYIIDTGRLSDGFSPPFGERHPLYSIEAAFEPEFGERFFVIHWGQTLSNMSKEHPSHALRRLMAFAYERFVLWENHMAGAIYEGEKEAVK